MERIRNPLRVREAVALCGIGGIWPKLETEGAKSKTSTNDE
jgi:hypothetical protein